MKTIRAKFIVNIFIAAIVVILIGAASFYFVFSQLSTNSSGNNLESVLRLTFLRVDSYLAERNREFNTLAKNTEISQGLKGDLCANKESNGSLYLPFSSDAWSRIAVVDSAYIVCAATNNDQSIAPEEQKIVERATLGIPTISDVVFLGAQKTPMVIMATPISFGTTSAHAVLLGRLSMDEAATQLMSTGIPMRLYTNSGIEILSTGFGHQNSANTSFPDAMSLWNFVSSLNVDTYGVMKFANHGVLVAMAGEPGMGGYVGYGWKLVALQPLDIAMQNNFATGGGLLSGLATVLICLLLFTRIPNRLLSELRQITYFTEQQLKGITEFVPRGKEIEIASAYQAIAKLATRYNVLARTKDDGAIKLAQELDTCTNERNRFAVMIGAMREGACAIDNDGKITLCNLSAASMIGLDRDEILGKEYKKIMRFYLDEDLNKIFDPLQKALISGGLFAEEGPYYLQQHSGQGLAVRIQSTVIRSGPDRAAVGIFVLMRDVEKEIAVEQSKNEFISVTSHQMRTPLATMRWHLERLLHAEVPPSPKTLKSYLERIDRNNKRMIRLTDALLDASRIDLDVTQSKDVEVDLPNIVKEVLDEIDEEILKQRNISQDYEGIKGQKVQCDQYLVRVVLENFIENAVIYTKPGGRIDIIVGMDGDSLRIDVRDDGIGIAADMKDKIFSKFSRGKDATAMSPEGTGLGLYITKSLVERAGGKIWFKSSRNEGSTFSVRLPLGDPNNN